MLQSIRYSKQDHRKVFAIALPMILSNIAAPMLGLVDTAIIGHLPHAIYLSAVAVGAMAINFIYLLAVFLRMSTTGIVAQAFGAGDLELQRRHTGLSICFAFILGAFLILIQPILLWVLWNLVEASAELRELATTYVHIRLWSAPAALMILVALGTLLGRQQSRQAMTLVILLNALNVLFDVILIIGLDMNVTGAAWASVGAEYITAAVALTMLRRHLQLRLHHIIRIDMHQCKQLLTLNQHILVRSVVLQLCMAMMTGYASYYGPTTVAANAVLMQFLMLISLGLDGIAYSSEALLGEAKGRKQAKQIQHWFRLCLFWSCVFATLYSLIFLLAGQQIINRITNIEDVRQTAAIYLPWLMVMPLLAHWSYLFDGVYIGLSQSKAMRDSMLLAALCGFLPAWALTLSWENHGLWFALSVFMVSRGLWQWWLLHRRQMFRV